MLDKAIRLKNTIGGALIALSDYLLTTDYAWSSIAVGLLTAIAGVLMAQKEVK